jgi:hypothetical protein
VRKLETAKTHRKPWKFKLDIELEKREGFEIRSAPLQGQPNSWSNLVGRPSVLCFTITTRRQFFLYINISILSRDLPSEIFQRIMLRAINSQANNFPSDIVSSEKFSKQTNLKRKILMATNCQRKILRRRIIQSKSFPFLKFFWGKVEKIFVERKIIRKKMLQLKKFHLRKKLITLRLRFLRELFLNLFP